ncbi:MAG TPA: recombination regulator RecX [Candidatus Eisenbergiella merdipullorum]|uniref:Regulatory protein RecX n=1 Tax=Candidatus Eisenbergiella merdipullorum TaxID=2838553 RepID=A0A9D2I6P4_9FIRM|nr:recombination regulator RecX [Candidatus Eisenbergiella merdipullorum]
MSKGRMKYAVSIDEECMFALYKGELSRYRIREGEELSEETFDQIMHTLLPKRAKLRCMNLLKSRNYTRRQLAEKLREGKYPESVIEEAISYVESYGYVDDAAYAESYVEDQIGKKGLRRIEEELLRKGVDRGLIEEAVRKVQERDGAQEETALIRSLLEKKHFRPETADLSEKRRIQAFLFRKGFTAEGIRKAMLEGYDSDA